MTLCLSGGHHNPREGGPKGIDVHEPWGLMVTSCAEQPLAFFDIRDIAAGVDASGLDELGYYAASTPVSTASRC